MNQWDCPLKRWRLGELKSSTLIRVDCKQWTCPEHGEMVRWRWRKRAQLVKWDLMWTFTQVPEDQKEAQRAWHAIRRRLRRKGVTTYLRALEIGEGGMRHWHVLVAGQKYMRRRGWDHWLTSIGMGQINHVKRVDDPVKDSNYVTKYVTKGNESELHGQRIKGWRRVTVSRDIPTWKRLNEVLDIHTKRGDTGHKWLSSRNYRVPANRIREDLDGTVAEHSQLESGMVERDRRRGSPIRWAEWVLFNGRVPSRSVFDTAGGLDRSGGVASRDRDCGICAWRISGGRGLPGHGTRRPENDGINGIVVPESGGDWPDIAPVLDGAERPGLHGGFDAFDQPSDYSGASNEAAPRAGGRSGPRGGPHPLDSQNDGDRGSSVRSERSLDVRVRSNIHLLER